MSKSLSEQVLRVPGRSLVSIINEAASLRRYLRYRPDEPVDVLRLVDEDLPRLGCQVYSEDDCLMGGSFAVTKYERGHCVIIMRNSLFEALASGGSNFKIARTTAAHECGHALLHHNVLRVLSHHDPSGQVATAVLHRRKDLPSYEDPEWQAWAFAGELLMPLEALLQLGGQAVHRLSALFSVSTKMVETHLGLLSRSRHYPIQLHGGRLYITR